jgi:hypothetical protein
MWVDRGADGHGAIYNFNESRLKRIANATTLKEATHMGIGDWFEDLFGGGVKRAAITKLFNEITQLGSNDCSERGRFARFEQLKEMAVDRRQDQFTSVVERDGDYGTWSFTLSIGGEPIYQKEKLEDKPDHFYSEFKLKQEVMAAKPGPAVMRLMLDETEYLRGSTEAMFDDLEKRDWMTNNLGNCVYARGNFKGIPPRSASSSSSSTSSTFIAIFQERGGPANLVEFSEVEGEKLKDALHNGRYENLKDLAMHGHLTKDDRNIQKVTDGWWESAAFRMGVGSSDDLCDWIGNLPEGEREAVTNMLRGTAVGKTNLAELYLQAASSSSGAHGGRSEFSGIELSHNERTMRQQLELASLRGLVQNEEPEATKADLAATWKSKEEEFIEVEWPDSKVVVKLRKQIWRDYVNGNNMQFDESTGALKLTIDPEKLGRDDDKKRALTDFIGNGFGAKPGHSDFQNIANNVLPFFQQGGRKSMMDKMLEVVGGAGNRTVALDASNPRMTFTLSVNKRENGEADSVSATGNSSMRYKNIDDSIGLDEGFARYRFVQKDDFVISTENLRTDPANFKPADNLRSVRRTNTVEFAI